MICKAFLATGYKGQNRGKVCEALAQSNEKYSQYMVSLMQYEKKIQ